MNNPKRTPMVARIVCALLAVLMIVGVLGGVVSMLSYAA